MKLHLPLGLRRALFAVLATLPVASVSSAYADGEATAVSEGNTFTSINGVVADWNSEQAQQAYETAYQTAFDNAKTEADAVAETKKNEYIAQAGNNAVEDEKNSLSYNTDYANKYTECLKEQEIYITTKDTTYETKIKNAALNTYTDTYNKYKTHLKNNFLTGYKDTIFGQIPICDVTARGAYEAALAIAENNGFTGEAAQEEACRSLAQLAADAAVSDTAKSLYQIEAEAAALAAAEADPDAKAAAEAYANAWSDARLAEVRTEAETNAVADAEAYGAAEGLKVQEAAGTAAAEAATKDTAYVYHTQYGSTITQGNVTVNTDCCDKTEVIVNQDGVKSDLFGYATTDGNLVLQDDSFYKLTDVSEETTHGTCDADGTTEHHWVNSITMTVYLSDYVLGETADTAVLDLGEGSVSMADGVKANTITIGSENTASLTAAAIDMAALSDITVQKGSSVSATVGGVSLTTTGNVLVTEGSAIAGADGVALNGVGVEINGSAVTATAGNVTLMGDTVKLDAATLTAAAGNVELSGAIELANASGLMGKNVVLTAGEGDISLSGGSGVSAETLAMTGNNVLLDAAQITLTGSASAPDLEGDAALVTLAEEGVTPDVNINGTSSVVMQNGTAISGGNVLVHSDGSVSLDATSAVVGVDSVTLSGTESLNVSGALSTTNGDIALSGGTVTLSGAQVQKVKGNTVSIDGDTVLLTGATVIGSGGSNKPNIVTITGDTVTFGDADIKANQVWLEGGKVTMNDAAYISNCGYTTIIGDEIVLTEGAGMVASQEIKLEGDKFIEMTGGAYLAGGGKGLTMSSDGYITLSKGQIRNVNGGIVMNAKGAITLEEESLAGARKGDISLSGNSISVSGGVKVWAMNGDVSLVSSGANKISASEVYAGCGYNENNGTEFIYGTEIGEITLVGTQNTIESGSVVESTGNMSLNGADVNLLITTIEGVGTNKIDASTVTAGALAMNGRVGLNTINGSSVTATTGDVTLDSILNTISGSTFSVENGSLKLTSATPEGISNILALLDKSGIADKLGLGDVDLDINANLISGDNSSITVGNTVELVSMLNALTGTGTVQAGQGVSLNGALNGVIGTNVSSTAGDITLTAESEGSIAKTIAGLLSNYNINVDENVVTLLGSLEGGINLMTGGGLKAEAGNVSLTGSANLITGGDVLAADDKDVSLSGAVNAVTGGSVQGGSIAMDATQGELNLGELISGVLNAFTKDENTETGTEGSETTGSSLSDVIANLGSLQGGANAVLGGELTATTGNVELDGTVNAVTGGSVAAATGDVSLSGAVNAVTGGSIAGGNVELDGTKGELNIGEMIAGVVESLTQNQGAQEGSEGTKGELNLGDMLAGLDSLEGGVNAVLGGDVTATTGSVNMNATANLVTNGNIMAAEEVSLNGAINAVTGGTMQGGNIALNANEGQLNIGELINGVIGSLTQGDNAGEEATETLAGDEGLTEGDTEAATLTGGANVVLGGELTATTGNAGLDGTVNAVTGGSITAANGNVSLSGAVNAVTGGSIAGGNVVLDGTKGSLNIGEMIGSVVESLTQNQGEQEGSDSAMGDLNVGDMLAGLGEMQGGVNAVLGGDVTATSGSVNMNATANLVTNGNIAAAENVSLNGTINAVTGGSIAGGNVTLDGTKGELNIGEMIADVVESLTQNQGEQEGSDSLLGDLNVGDMLAGLGEMQGGVNAVLGGDVTATTGSVNMNATANLVTNGNIAAAEDVSLNGAINAVTGGTMDAAEAVSLSGAINAVTGGSITGGSVDFFASEENTLDLGEMLGSLSGVLGSSDQTGEGQLNWSEIIDGLGDALTGNANLMIGGEVKATSADVNMDGTLNVLAGGTVSAPQGNVQLTGMANVLAGGTVTDNQATEWQGGVNAVLSGTLEGGSVTLTGTEEGLNLGELLTPVLDSVGADSTITDLVSNLGDISGNINAVIGGAVNATNGNVTMNGTLNLQTGGVVSATGTVTLNGAVNALTGGELSGTKVLMQKGENGLDLGAMIKPMLDAAGVDASITDALGNLGEINGNINLVTGDAVVNGTDTVRMDALANVVMGENAQVTGGKVTLTGTQFIGLPLGSIVTDLLPTVLPEGTTLPDAVTGMLDSMNGEIALNANVVMNGGTISATEKAVLDASVNYVGNGGRVSGGDLVQLYGPLNLVMSNGSLSSENGTVRMNGYGPSLGELGVQIPAEYAGYAEQLGLSSLLDKQFGVNWVMGEGAAVSGNHIEMNAGLMNMVADRAELTADKNVTMSSMANMVVDGTTVQAGGTVSLSGTLNLVSHLVLNDFVNAIQNGTPLPTDGALTTLSGQDVQLWGAANVLHGNVHVTATGDVVMSGTGEPLIALNTMTVQQVVDLARELGVPALLDEAKTKVLDTLMDYAEANNMTDLVDAAVDLGLEDQLNGIYSDLKDFVAENGDVELNLSLNGNVNAVSGGAVVNGNNVLMDGTVNYVGDLASVTGNTVKIDGMVNAIAGGAELSGGELTLSGGANLLVDTTLDNVKDAIENGNLDSLVAGGATQTTLSAKNITLDAEANLINGKVALVAEQDVTLTGKANIVAGIAKVQGGNAVNLDATANVIAGGATVSGAEINMTGGVNAVVDTTPANVLDALKNQSIDPLLQGGSKETTLTATGDINLGATANVVNGGKVSLTAGNAVNMEGALNVLSGNATVNAKDINMNGTAIEMPDLNTVLPEELAGIADAAAKLEELGLFEDGVNANVVAGGAQLNADNDINLSGIATAVVDTTLTNVVDALKDQSLDPLMQGGSSETTLSAGNDINLTSKLNVVNGGKVSLNAGNAVNMEGALNMVGSNATVNAKNINLAGTEMAELDLTEILPAEYAEKAEQLGLNELLEDGVNANLVAGGALLDADNDITLSGIASAVIDTTLTNVVDALTQQSIDPLLQGGTSETVLSAGNDINMISKLNVVNGGKVSLNAGNDVTMAGVINVVNGNAIVNAQNAIELDSAANVVAGGAALTADSITMAGNAALGDEFAALIEMVLPDVNLPSGLSAGVVMGNGTTVTATDTVEMLSNVNVVADEARVSAQDTKLAGTLNAVTGGAAVTAADKAEMLGTAANLVMDGAEVSGATATMTGAANVVQGGSVTAESGDLKMESLGAVNNGLSEVINSLIPDSEVADGINSLLAQGNVNAVTDGADVKAAGNVSMHAAVNMIEHSSVTAGGNVVLNNSSVLSMDNAVVVATSGDVTISGGSATVTDSTISAEQGKVTLSNMDLVMSGGSVLAGNGLAVSSTTASLSEVELGGAMSISADSTVDIESLVTSYGVAEIENLGSLNLQDAIIAESTIYNDGNISVTGNLTLQSATLVFTVDSLTMNSTAIHMDGGVISTLSTYSANSADAIAGVNFVLTEDSLTGLAAGEQKFNLVLFTGASDADYELISNALQDSELTFTMPAGALNTEVSNLQVQYVGNNVVVSGTVTIPEPTTATLSLLALAALAARRRRK